MPRSLATSAHKTRLPSRQAHGPQGQRSCACAASNWPSKQPRGARPRAAATASTRRGSAGAESTRKAKRSATRSSAPTAKSAPLQSGRGQNTTRARFGTFARGSNWPKSQRGRRSKTLQQRATAADRRRPEPPAQATATSWPEAEHARRRQQRERKARPGRKPYRQARTPHWQKRAFAALANATNSNSNSKGECGAVRRLFGEAPGSHLARSGPAEIRRSTRSAKAWRSSANSETA